MFYSVNFIRAHITLYGHCFCTCFPQVNGNSKWIKEGLIQFLKPRLCMHPRAGGHNPPHTAEGTADVFPPALELASSPREPASVTGVKLEIVSSGVSRGLTALEITLGVEKWTLSVPPFSWKLSPCVCRAGGTEGPMLPTPPCALQPYVLS